MSDSHRSSQDTLAQFDQYVIPNYGRYPINLVRGEGSRIWDSEGTEYLDLFPGWGCNLLGHCPPRVVEAVQEQVAQLIHVPNTWLIEKQSEWAQLLSDRSFHGQSFFCNSGAEANEAAIKLARLRFDGKRYKIITFDGGFHGRTLATVTATPQPKYHEGLGPTVAGFVYAPYGDLDEVEKLIDDETCALMIEPVQGEGGVNVPPAGFLAGLRDLADRHGILLIFDEVQTGCGRTGNWFGYQHFGVVPDVMTLAKAICGGIAGGAMLTTHELAKSLRPGMHASTFGGNPIAAAAGIATIKTIEDEGLLENVGLVEQAMLERFQAWRNEFEFITEIRSVGMMFGIELALDATRMVEECMKRRLLINCTQGNVIRLLPAMNLSEQDVSEGCDRLYEAMVAFSNSLSVQA